MKTKISTWKRLNPFAPALVAAAAFFAGCASEPASNYHNPKFVLSDAKRAESNNFPPAPSKPDDFLSYYSGYSADKTKTTRMGEGDVGTTANAFTPAPGAQNYGGGYYGGYQPWGVGGYGGYGYGGYGYGYGYHGW